MGRLSNEPIIQHFSHPHPLQLSSLLDNMQQQHSLAPPPSCANCRLPASRGGYAYTCSPCGYVLHVQCSQMPPLIQHASHRAHPLSLLPVPAYPEGSFDCDACARPGTGFSYHCHACGDVDLHTLCASLPLSLPNPTLHPHPLALTFAPPYDNKAFSCDVCAGMGSPGQWLYRCAPCEFDAHLECGSRQQQRQGAAAVVGRSGSVVVQGSPQAVAMSRSGSGGMQGLVGAVGGAGGMVRQMVQGLVGTTAQQIGSRFVPGNGGAGANGGGGGRGRGRGVGYNGWNGNGAGRGGGGGGGPPGAWNYGYGGGRGQGGGGPPNGAQASYDSGGNYGDASGGWNGYVADSSAGDASGGGNGGGGGVDYGSVADAAAGVDYGSVVDAVAGVGSAVLNAFSGGSDDNSAEA